jgi:Fe2+ or Zn2+ uptake regulation protein
MTRHGDWPSGLKKTKQRLIVRELLDEAKSPLSAASLYEKALAKGEKIAFSTVYRILEVFVNCGIAEQINVSGSEFALYEKKHTEHRHYAICIECERLILLKECPLEHFSPVPSDFTILEHRLEVSGICADCRCRREKRKDKK